MARSLLEIRTLLRMYIDDESSDRFTDVELLPLINEAQSIIEDVVDEVNERHFIEGQRYDVNATHDSYEFPLPSNFKKLLLAEREVPGEIPVRCKIVDFAQRHDDSVEGLELSTTRVRVPRVYLRNGKVGVVDPDASYTLCLWYNFKLPDLAVDADETQIPTEYANLVALQAAKLTKGEDDGQLSPELTSTFQSAIGRMRLNLESRQEQDAREVRYIPEY